MSRKGMSPPLPRLLPFALYARSDRYPTRPTASQLGHFFLKLADPLRLSLHRHLQLRNLILLQDNRLVQIERQRSQFFSCHII